VALEDNVRWSFEAPGIDAVAKKVAAAYKNIEEAQIKSVRVTSQVKTSDEGVIATKVKLAAETLGGSKALRTYTLASIAAAEATGGMSAAEAKYAKQLVNTVTEANRLAEVEKRLSAQRSRAAARESTRRKSVSGIISSKSATIPGGTTGAELAAYKTAVGNLRALTVAHQTSVAKLNTVWGEVAVGKIRAYGDKTLNLQTQIGRVEDAEKKLGATARKEIAQVAIERARAAKESAAQAIARQAAIDADRDRSVARYKAAQQKMQAVAQQTFAAQFARQNKLETQAARMDIAQTARINALNAARAAASAKEIARQNAEKIAASFGTKMRTRVGGHATATQGEKAAVLSATVATERYIRANQILGREVDAMWKRAGRGAGTTDARMRGLYNTTERVQLAIRKLGSTVEQENARMGKSIHSVNLSWQSMARLVVVQLMHRAISAMSNAMREGIRTATEYEIKLSEIRTISQENQLSFAAWGKGLRELSDSWGIGIIDQAEAAYQALSNQVAKGTGVLNFMSEANRFAVTTASTAAASVNVLTAATNAFGIRTASTNKTAATLFKTIELGRVRASEMGNTFGRVAVPASQLGLNLQDLGAAVATSTIRGIKFSESSTLLRAILMKLIRPTKDMQKLFDKMGVASGQAAIQAYGFQGVMQQVEEHTKGSATEIGKLFSRIRAVTGGLLYSGAGLVRYRENLLKVKDAQASYARATEIAMESTGKRLQIQFDQLKNYFLTGWGQPILKMIDTVQKATGGFVPIMKSLIITVVALGVAAGVTATVIGVKMVAAMAAAATAGTVLSAVMLGLQAAMGVGAWITVAGAALFAVVLYLQQATAASKKLSAEWSKGISEDIKNDRAAIVNLEESIIKALDNIAGARLRATAEVQKVYNAWLNQQLEAQDKIKASLKQTVADVQTAIKVSLTDIKKQITETKDAFKKADDAMTSVTGKGASNTQKANVDIFDIGLEDKGTKTKIRMIENEVKRLAKIRRGLNADQLKDFERATDRMNTLIRKQHDLVKTYNKEVQEREKKSREAANKAAIKDSKEGLAYRRKVQNFLEKQKELEVKIAAARRKVARATTAEERAPAAKRGAAGRTIEKAQAALDKLLRTQVTLDRKKAIAAADHETKAKALLAVMNKQKTVEGLRFDVVTKIRDALAEEIKLRDKIYAAQETRAKKAAATQAKLAAQAAIEKARAAELKKLGTEAAKFKVKDLTSIKTEAELKDKLLAQQALLNKIQGIETGKGVPKWQLASDRVRELEAKIAKLDSIRVANRGNDPTGVKTARRFQAQQASFKLEKELAALQARVKEDPTARLKVEVELTGQLATLYKKMAANIARKDAVAIDLENLKKAKTAVKALTDQLEKLQATRDEYFAGNAVGGKADKEKAEVLGDKMAAVLTGIRKNLKTGKISERYAEYIKTLVEGFVKNPTLEIKEALLRHLNAQLIGHKSSANMFDAVIKEATTAIKDIKVPQAIDDIAAKMAGYQAALVSAKNRVEALSAKMGATTDKKLDTSGKIIETFALRVGAADKALEFFITRLNTSKIPGSAPPDTGTPVGKIAGGYTRGLDTIKRSLSPGEFVMNPAASNQFYGQLQAMNAGVHRADAPNNNITGDWNISVNSTGSTDTDIRAVAKGLRREIRRGRVSLS